MTMLLCAGRTAHVSRERLAPSVTGLLLFTVMLIAPGLATYGGEWIPFAEERQQEVAVRIDAIDRSMDRMVIHVECPGVFIDQASVEGNERIQLDIAGESSIEIPGWPMVPVVKRLIAVPEYERIEVSVRLGSQTSVQLDYPVAEYYPPPEDMLLLPTEPFPSSLWDTAFPAEVSELTCETRIRDLRVICLSVYPVQYIHKTRILLCHESIEIELRFTNAAESLARSGTGPFDRVCRRSIMYYDDQVVRGTLPMLSASTGSWERCTGSDPLQCCTQNGTDYLIMAASAFFHSEWLDSLAAKRASYNGFNVSIVNVDSLGMTSASPDGDILEFLTALYDSATAQHMPDGHLGYVLLAGSYQDTNDVTLVPARLFEHRTSESVLIETYASDNWFACVNDTGPGRAFPDVFIGRLCAQDTTELRVLIRKTLHWEPLPADSSGWSSTFFITTAMNVSGAIQQMVERVSDDLKELAENNSYTVREVRGLDYAEADSAEMRRANVDSLNAGAVFMWYSYHGDECRMGAPPCFSSNSVEDLTNRGSLCVLYTHTCKANNFAGLLCETDQMRENVGVKLTTHEDGGAVAVIGAQGLGSGAWDQSSLNYAMGFFGAILENHTPFIAEALLEQKLVALGHYSSARLDGYIEKMGILGDPALNVRLRGGFEEYCDLGVSGSDSDMVFLRMEGRPDPCSTIVWVRNKTPFGVPDTSVSVRFDVKGPGILEWKNLGIGTVDSIPPWDSEPVVFFWSCDSLAENGIYTFRVWVDSADVIVNEAYAENNIAVAEKQVGIDSYKFWSSDSMCVLTSPVAGYFSVDGENRRYIIVADTSGTVYAVPPSHYEDEHEYDTGSSGVIGVALGDLERDGTTLQIVSSRHHVHAIDVLGDVLAWSRDLGDTIVSTAPSIGDFDGDLEADLEVCVGCYDGTTARVAVLDAGAVISVWDLGDTSQYGIPTSLLLVDLGSNDTLDVVAGTSRPHTSELLSIEG